MESEIEKMFNELLNELGPYNPKLFVYQSNEKIVISDQLKNYDSIPVMFEDLARNMWRFSYDHELSDFAFDESFESDINLRNDPTTLAHREKYKFNSKLLKKIPKGKNHKGQNASIFVYLLSKSLFPTYQMEADIKWDVVIFYIQYLMLKNYNNQLLSNSEFYNDFKFIVNYRFGLPRINKKAGMEGKEIELVELKEENEKVKKILKDKITSFNKNFNANDLETWHMELISSLFSYTQLFKVNLTT